MKHKISNTKKSASFSWKAMMAVLLCLLTALPMSAQNRIVRGTVVDQTGETVIGANVRVNGTTRGVITDINGEFEIAADAKEKLTISFIGYIDAIVAADKTNLKITLKEEQSSFRRSGGCRLWYAEESYTDRCGFSYQQ